MERLQRSPFFAFGLALCGAATIAAAGLGWRARQQAERWEGMLRQRQAERDGLARLSPRLDEATGRAIAEDCAAAERRLADLRRALQGRPAESAPAPVRSIDGYFALAAFAGRMRELAARHAVEVRADERFGFATYTQAGPEPSLVPAVQRQQVAVEHLVETLLASRPASLVSVQREAPAGSASDPAVDERGAAAADFFIPDERLRLRGPGRRAGGAYRLEFTGQTPALRAFVNALAAAERPLFVRCIEVEPIAPQTPEPRGGAPAGLVVGARLARFAVVVDCLEIPSEPAS